MLRGHIPVDKDIHIDVDESARYSYIRFSKCCLVYIKYYIPRICLISAQTFANLDSFNILFPITSSQLFSWLTVTELNKTNAAG